MKKQVNPDDVEMLEDLIVAAVNEALEKVDDRVCFCNVQIYRRNGRRNAGIILIREW